MGMRRGSGDEGTRAGRARSQAISARVVVPPWGEVVAPGAHTSLEARHAYVECSEVLAEIAPWPVP